MAHSDQEINTTGGDQDVDATGLPIAEKLPTSPVPGAKKQHEDDDEDFRKMAEIFSKIVEKVREATPGPGRYKNLPTIYVVPRDLVKGTVDSYEPEVVCIGPLYNQTERTKKPRRKLEKYKWWCLRKLLVNAGVGAADAWIRDVHEPLLRECLKTVKDLEPRIRHSYDDDISVDSDTLSLMMLLDGSLLLHLLMDFGHFDRDDRMIDIGRLGTWEMVTCDVLLLQNQIPFFILEALFEHFRRSRARYSEGNLVKWALQLFSDLDPGPAGDDCEAAINRNVHHLLHLYYRSIIGKLSPPNVPSRSTSIIASCPLFCINISCSTKKKSTTEEEGQATTSRTRGLPWVPCAKELEEAGITFRANKKDTSFMDVSFSHGVLEIPQLKLYDNSEALFRNLIAFEQTYLYTGLHVTAYAMFMECLIKTPADMRLLHQSGVLESHMSGDKDGAMGFFTGVSAQTLGSTGENQLRDVMEAVVNYQAPKWRRWRAVLKRNYFSNPWATTSVVAAFLLLLMTALQTFFSVYGYYNPYSRN